MLQGHTKSCGCIHKEGYGGFVNDLTGKRFGRLTVLEYAGKSNHKVSKGSGKKSQWKCICDCGKETIVTGNSLISGITQSCGCLKSDRTTEAFLKPLDGQRFGKLTALYRVENDRFNHVRYMCKCDCGGTAVVDAGNLRRGVTSSCGCLKSVGESKINNWLTSHGVNFRTQYSVDSIRYSFSGYTPAFDFAVFDSDGNLSFFIEYNGIQHYKATSGWNTEEIHQYNILRDKEKMKLCAKNRIGMVIIPYWELDRVERLLPMAFDMFNVDYNKEGGDANGCETRLSS